MKLLLLDADGKPQMPLRPADYPRLPDYFQRDDTVGLEKQYAFYYEAYHASGLVPPHVWRHLQYLIHALAYRWATEGFLADIEETG